MSFSKFVDLKSYFSTNKTQEKTVDQALAQFNKVLSDLDDVEEQQSSKVVNLSNELAQKEAALKAANTEAMRAQEARSKIKALLGK